MVFLRWLKLWASSGNAPDLTSEEKAEKAQVIAILEEQGGSVWRV